MNKFLIMLLAGVFILGPVHATFAGHHDKGSMKGSAGDHKTDENKSKIQNVMKDYITENSTGDGGTLSLKDPKSGKMRNLSFIELHSKVGMKKGKHYSCADFKDVDSSDLVDVDLFVDVKEGDIEVTEALVHKVNGEYVDGSKPTDKGSSKENKKGSGY